MEIKMQRIGENFSFPSSGPFLLSRIEDPGKRTGRLVESSRWQMAVPNQTKYFLSIKQEFNYNFQQKR
jgi:hypothetical protein